ncbi:MAG TPA: DUF1572 domain-containing protein [Aequorivita sp.]|jgi:hypothetical protein|uniref:DUF1572 domain-containing protein n=1 Tax=Flavobacteriaceae TaxID=49546 RepID=UPI000E87895F|nr:DUF1572 domain-containing protein [Aequorivita vladivostokensis]HAV55075.1 DUF1572 domain-containing protein [Aequorivita sp.]|tara:strand:+ start:395 stop:877 length:483 start_codon:yes stop_codon:yes gene_type:complete
MKSNHQLADRFREVLLNGTWVANTNYKDQLQNLPLQLAQTKVGDLNTIAILAQHIHYYIQGVANVFKGGPLEIRDAYSFDFPAFASEAEWQSFLKTFFNDAEEFATLVSQLPENMLNNDFVDKKYGTYQRNIEGMIEHCYYHLGQLVLIKKLTSNNYTPN